MKFDIHKTVDIRLNVRLVTLSLYHNYVFEGPCRFEKGEKLKKEYDLTRNAKIHNAFVKNATNALPKEEVNLLEPIHFQYDESFIVTDDDLETIGGDDHLVDLYIFLGAITDLLIEFPQRYNKPMIVLGMCFNTMSTAALLARGFEIYPCETIEDAAEMTKILRVRKALADTKVLAMTRMNSNNAPGMLDNFISLDEVTRKLGTRFSYFNIHEFFDQTHNIESGSNPTTPGKVEYNINDEDEEEIGKMMDEFIDGAIECDMKRKDIYPSMKAHYLINKLLQRTGCNAFTAPCFDVCATRRFNEERFTFCLNHSLNNENGIPSSCEYDVPSLLSMVILSNLAKSPAYMGNTIPNPIKNGSLGRFVDAENTPYKYSIKAVEDKLRNTENLVMTWHSVPNRKLKGYDATTAPYSIRSFTHSGWGTTIRYDFSEDVGQVITMCRFDPTCSKIFVAKGTIMAGIGYKNVNCTEGVIFQVDDSKEFFKKISLVGNHNPLVYGDCFDQVIKLADVLGLMVLTI